MSQSVLGFAPAVAIVDGIPTTTSVDVARHFGKRHEHVMDAIRGLLAQLPENAHPNFRVSTYTDSTGRTLPAYRLTRDGFTLLAMGFTGKKALAFKLAYIDAFNRMEAELRAHHPIQIEQAHAAARDAAARTYAAVLDAVLTSGPEWECQRWTISFMPLPDGPQARISSLPFDAVAGSPASLAKAIAAGGWRSADVALIADAAVSCLIKRSRPAAQQAALTVNQE